MIQQKGVAAQEGGALGTAGTPPPPAHKKGYAYTDLRQLGVHGRAFNDTAPGQYYSRLPAAAKADVTAAVWGLSLARPAPNPRPTLCSAHA